MADQTPELATALAGMLGRFFKSTSPDLLRLTAEKETILEVAAGAALFHQDERSDEVYFVLRWRLRAVQADTRGRPVTLGEIGRGETIGELAMILGERRIRWIC
jgi:NTE family protein